MRKAFFIILLIIFARPSFSQNINPFWTIGPSFSYHIEGGGLSYGIEANYFPSQLTPITSPALYGFTFNLSYSPRGVWYVHSGFEAITLLLVGLDVGPSLMIYDGIHPGFSIIPYAGIIGYGFYNFSWYNSVGYVPSDGVVLKIPTIIPSAPKPGW